MSERPLPTGDVAFLFSDIEGSTRLVERLGIEGWTPLLARHRAILRGAWRAHGGTEVSTEGDSFFVVFTDPAAALAAAGAAQRALAAEPWPEDAPIRVRMGLHAGMGALDLDGDYVGHDVHRAARVAGAANGGQVLVSDALITGVSGRLPPGIAIRSLGEHRLKDLRPEPIGLLVIDGLEPVEIPIRSVDARPNNLPTQLTSFVGRERELDEARDLLERTRLLTITGPGGTGKSRFSLQLAAVAAELFPDGTWFVPLAAVLDPELVPSAVARALGIAEPPGRPVLDVLVEHLAGKRVLLVVDNLEHVLAAAPHLGTLLRSLPLLHLVATSRAPLRIAGEQEYPLQGLPVPVREERLSAVARAAAPVESGATLDPRELAGYEAIRLFVARAAAIRPGFALTAGNARDVAAIVSHLGGMPLAIELAAARMRILTPAAIHARLERVLDLPGTAMLDAPERQRTLRGAIAWSYDLLDLPAQRMLDRCGVFRDGFDLDRAAAIGGSAAELGADPLDALSALVEHSLVRLGEADGDPRYLLLEPIREFALERLETSGAADSTRQRHAAAIRALTEEAAPELAGSAQRGWLDRLELEHANIRAALDHAEATRDVDTALRLCAATWRFWQKRGYLREARVRVERLLAAPWTQEPTLLRAAVLEAAGGIAYWHGEPDGAAPYYTEALAIQRALGDSPGIANACYNLSFCSFIGGPMDTERLSVALELLGEALARYREVGDRQGTANALWGIGCAQYFASDNAAAVGPLTEALALYRSAGDRTQEGWTLHQLGSALHKLGETDRARTLLREGLAIFAEALDVAGVTMVVEDLSAVAVADGDRERAARLYGFSKRLQQTSGAEIAGFVERAFEELSRPSARRSMTPDELERLAAAGRALPLEVGIAYAAGTLDPFAEA